MHKQRPDRSTGAPTGKRPTVLVVDRDRVSQRFVELALDDCNVESVNDAAAAVEVLRTQVVDLIVSETMLPDMNGLRFFRRLREESRLRAIPFIFLSSDARVETKIVALRAGADECLAKPCDAGELAARVQGLLGRSERIRCEYWNRTYTLAGDFSAMSFPDLVTSIDMAHRSGILSVLSGHVGGQVFFEEGKAIHARYGNLTGPEAFYRLVWAPHGQFEFAAGPVELAPTERTLNGHATMLIMEAARIADTAQHEGTPTVLSSGADADTRATSVVPQQPRAVGPRPDAMLAAQYEMALRDPFALGDLKILNDEELARWTSMPVGRDRVHMLLIASLAEAISAMLPLAGAPTERLIVDSLEPGRKALALAFFLRDERLLDLVLLDARDPSAFLGSLRRVPSVIMFAPPHGDWMALGTQASAVLETLFDTLNPTAIMGIGQPTLKQALDRMGMGANGPRVVRSLDTPLGDPSSDFRLLLVHALRLWTVGGKSLSEGRPAGAEW